MEFSVPTNWQAEITEALPVLNKSGEIAEVYGKLALDELGGGRPASALAFVSRREAERQIKILRRVGFKFNYLLNALCMDNMEFTAIGQRRMRRLCEWLVKVGVDSVTIANPYVALWIKKNYPSLSLSVSVIAHVDSLNRAKFWEGLGVDKITFPAPVVNRNFQLIKLLRKLVKCKIQLIANNPCLQNCPTSVYHHAMLSHASQDWHACKGWVFDYYLVMCRLKRIREPVNFIRSDWIRPEDIQIYQDLGIDSIKLVDRRAPTDMITKIIKAYMNRRYEGNLLDLFPTFYGKTFNSHQGWLGKISILTRILKFNPIRVMRYSRLLDKIEVHIDNRGLDGFLQSILGHCGHLSCDLCGYCQRTAEKVVTIDQGYLQKALKEYAEAVDELLTSGLG